VANATNPTITIGKIVPGEPLSLPLRGEGIFNPGEEPMNDGDMDVLCIVLFLAVTTFCIFYSYTPIC
jgi:hypothetical protein